VVIYDAEIMPDRDQLKKAYLAFKIHGDYAAFQTRLDHYNADKNLLTKLFNAEFSFYYDLFLPGLQKLNFPIPLSGHSVHFRTQALRTAGAWDPYNVAEDCDMGIRLYRMGFKVGILDSVSREEATDTVTTWAMQRTRWMKGFIQTSIVHLRHPMRFKDDVGGWKNFFAFLLIVPGSVFLNISNIFYWVLLIAWLTTHSPLIQQIFPGIILTISFLSFVMGNFIFTYLNLIGSYRRGRMDLVKWSLFSPLYWVLLSIATIRATVQLILRPHHWEKTKHGVYIEEVEEIRNYTPIYPVRRGTVFVLR
jgi:cellulose synthase/poly-beta-1,6-N-acetylglucosamine synthase-like glycosyltransferase